MKSGESLARLKVNVNSLSPITEASIEDFLAVSSPKIMSIRIAGLHGQLARWWLATPPMEGYQPVEIVKDGQPIKNIVCTDPLFSAEKNLMAHCLLWFMHGEDVFVELKFAASQYGQWPELQRGAEALMADFQVRR